MRACVIWTLLVSTSWVHAGCERDFRTFAAARSGGAAAPARRLPDPKTLAKAGLQYYWRAKVPLGDSEQVARLWLLGEKLYCLTNTNHLVAVDALRGIVLWRYPVADPGKTVYRPCRYDKLAMSDKAPSIDDIQKPNPLAGLDARDAVLINGITNVLVLNRTTGDLIRRVQFKFGAGGSAAGITDGRNFFVPDDRGHYHAIRLQEGLTWWTMSIGDMIVSPMLYMNDKVFVAGVNGALHVVSASLARRQVWSRRLDGPVTASALVTQKGYFVPCEDRNLYAFEPATGVELWEPFECKYPLRDVPQASEISIFQYVRDSRKFFAVNIVNGKLRWSMTGPRKVLAAMDNNVYLLSGARMLIVDEVLGKVTASVPIGGMDLLAANTTAPAVYGATRKGGVYCIRPLSAGYLTAEMLRELDAKK